MTLPYLKRGFRHSDRHQDNQASVAPVTPTVVKNSTPVKVAAEQPVPVTVTEVPETNEYQDSAWIIQLVALKNADNARNLVADLQKRGYQAHVKQENDFTRVIIGPDVSKSKLETQLVELEKIKLLKVNCSNSNH